MAGKLQEEKLDAKLIKALADFDIKVEIKGCIPSHSVIQKAVVRKLQPFLDAEAVQADLAFVTKLFGVARSVGFDLGTYIPKLIVADEELVHRIELKMAGATLPTYKEADLRLFAAESQDDVFVYYMLLLEVLDGQDNIPNLGYLRASLTEAAEGTPLELRWYNALKSRNTSKLTPAQIKDMHAKHETLKVLLQAKLLIRFEVDPLL
ncbi:Hypothetical protein POVN_LOCUS44 [uncultured virus]|nr:Hypothetical protein POVN_LOCUS44 [uncultured virus]